MSIHSQRGGPNVGMKKAYETSVFFIKMTRECLECQNGPRHKTPEVERNGEKWHWGERGSNSRPQDNSEAMRPTR